MKTVKSLADLRRTALSKGAELVGQGVHFNAGRARATGAAPARPGLVEVLPPPPTATQPAGTLTRAEVDAMLSAHNERVTAQFASIISALKQTPNPPGAVVREWDFTVTYDSHHAITNVKAKARP
jgi:hypothetical protein